MGKKFALWSKCSLAVLLVAFGVALIVPQDPAFASDTVSGAFAMSTTERQLRHQIASSRAKYGDTSRETLRSVTELANYLSNDGFRSHDLLPLVEEIERISLAQFGPEHSEVAFALQWQGLLLTAMEDPQEALRRLERSLAIYTKASDVNAVWITIVLDKIRNASIDSGDVQRARAAAERGLTLAKHLYSSDDGRLAIAHNNLGDVLERLEQYDTALNHFRQALRIGERSLGESDPDVTPMIGNVGRVLWRLGDIPSAKAMFERRLRLVERRPGNDRIAALELAYALDDLAFLARDAGDYTTALGLQERSLASLRSKLDHNSLIVTDALDNLALIHSAMGNQGQAVAIYERTLATRERNGGSDPTALARTLVNLAVAHSSRGKPVAADLPMLFRAVQLYVTAGKRDGLWQAQSVLSETYDQLGQPELAVLWGKSAVNTLQQLRGGLGVLPEAMQASFMAGKYDIYQQLADRLIALGRIEEAQLVMQAFKDFELFRTLEQRGGRAPTELSLTGQEQHRIDQFNILRERLISLGEERRRLEVMQRSGRAKAEDLRRLKEISASAQPAAERELMAFFTQLEKAIQESRTTQIVTPEAPSATLTRLRATIADLARSEAQAKAVGLQYVVSPTRLSIILSSAGVPPIARQIALSRGELRQRVGQAQLLLANPDSDRARLQAALVLLHETLIGPILPDLRSIGARTLMLSLDDVLRYVPFAALSDGHHFLVEDYVLAVYNEAADKTLVARPPVTSRVAAFGASQGIDRLPALRSVPAELRSSVEQPNTSGRIWQDREFDRPRFVDSLHGGFNILHVASHFVLESGRPERSGLILGDQSRLSLADIAREDLRFDAFDLVTLSACQTAVGGGNDANGQEVESLGAKAQKQGARAVLATLWRINDGSTAQFMERFYRGRSQGTRNTAEALREAQLELVASGKPVVGKMDRSSPYYWAPFILLGNWR